MEHAAPARHASPARLVAAAVGAGLLLDGVILAVLAAVTPGGPVRRLVEALLSLGVLLPGVALLGLALDRTRTPRVRLLPGEIVLDGALLTLGVGMSAYQAGGVPYAEGAGQFAAVLVALCLGAIALLLSPPGTLRDSLVLITGTILLGIGLTQLGLPGIVPPRWSWISFLGITVPGMLLLIARERLRRAARAERDRGRRIALATVAGVLLVAGLTVMLYGSTANLVLGRNGFVTGVRGDAAGLVLWSGAVAFLAVTSEALSRRPRAAGVVFAAGAAALIAGERSVVMGRTPALAASGALPAAVPIVLAGVLVLVAGGARSTRSSTPTRPFERTSG